MDTRIYNGHTTTSDALWAGVPVLTLRGRHFASRVSESILNALGVDELVVRSLDAFEIAAVDLASVRAKLAKLRQRLPTKG